VEWGFGADEMQFAWYTRSKLEASVQLKVPPTASKKLEFAHLAFRCKAHLPAWIVPTRPRCIEPARLESWLADSAGKP
jgi:hypothetical protein